MVDALPSRSVPPETFELRERSDLKQSHLETPAMASQSPSASSTQHPKDESLIDKTADTVRGVAEQTRDVAARAQRAPGAMREAVDSSLKQQPMMTLAAVGALGFVLGALWKS
jgi:hypothetical protein